MKYIKKIRWKDWDGGSIRWTYKERYGVVYDIYDTETGLITHGKPTDDVMGVTDGYYYIMSEEDVILHNCLELKWCKIHDGKLFERYNIRPSVLERCALYSGSGIFPDEPTHFQNIYNYILTRKDYPNIKFLKIDKDILLVLTWDRIFSFKIKDKATLIKSLIMG